MKAPDFLSIDISNKNPVVSIDGIIGTSYWDDQYSFDEFKWNIEMLGEVSEIDVLISSAGGNVDIGIAIYNYLKKHPAKINTHVISQASSIASVIFLAGDTRTMGIGTTMFIHKPMMGVMGYDTDLDKASDDLKILWDSIIDIYEHETNQSREVLSELMENETLMNANECFRRGFSNQISNDATNVVDYNYIDINQLAKKEALNMSDMKNIGDVLASVQALNTTVEALAKKVESLDIGAGSGVTDNDDNTNALNLKAESVETVVVPIETVVNSKADLLTIKGICVAANVPENLAKAFESLNLADAKGAVKEFVEAKEISVASAVGGDGDNQETVNVFSKAFKNLKK